MIDENKENIESKQYDVIEDVLFGKLLPLLFFGFFTVAHVANIIIKIESLKTKFSVIDSMSVIHLSLTILFFFMMTYFYIVRTKPVGRTDKWSERLIAFLGSFIIMLSPLVAGQMSDNLVVLSVSLLFIVIGGFMTVYTLFHLRRNFSIIPEARELVRTGPYKLVRHPMYLSEIIWIFGSILPLFSPGILLLYALMVAFLDMRASFEERVLEKHFPEYGEFRKTTGKIIPFMGIEVK